MGLVDGSLTPEQADLLQRATGELASSNAIFEFQFVLVDLVALVGHLQLALRHEGTVGPSSDLIRGFIDSVVSIVAEAGFPASAEMMAHGDDPEWDQVGDTRIEEVQ